LARAVSAFPAHPGLGQVVTSLAATVHALAATGHTLATPGRHWQRPRTRRQRRRAPGRAVAGVLARLGAPWRGRPWQRARAQWQWPCSAQWQRGRAPGHVVRAGGWLQRTHRPCQRPRAPWQLPRAPWHCLRVRWRCWLGVVRLCCAVAGQCCACQVLSRAMAETLFLHQQIWAVFQILHSMGKAPDPPTAPELVGPLN